MTYRITASWAPADPDAAAYITAVEAADGQALEQPVALAIDNFVLGCKADGTWSAIKASCILAGARTLAGALVPLVGPAPTNFNFVSGDYNRKTGLVGNGSTKYLNANRNNNADPQNSRHLSVFASSASTSTAVRPFGGTSYGAGDTSLYCSVTTGNLGGQSSSLDAWSRSDAPNPVGFIGQSRTASNLVTSRAIAVSTPHSVNSLTPKNESIHMYTNGVTASLFSNARLAYYSIGESLDLTLLDARVTALVAAFAAAIP